MFERTVFITGGAGFIGANLVRLVHRQKSDWRIIVVDVLTYAGNREYIEDIVDGERVVFEQVDVSDREEVERLFKTYQPNGVMHLAAESHVDRSISGPRPFIVSNIVGTFELIDAARRHWVEEGREGRFLHVSTDEVYGDLGPDDDAFTEETPYHPSSPYSASKASADHLVYSYVRTFGLDAVITNCSNNYGPYQYPEKLIPVIVRNLRDRNELPVYGDGSNVRDWLFVEDHCEALLTAFEKGKAGESYNIGTQNEWSNIELVRLICDVYDKITGLDEGSSREFIKFVPDRPGHDARYAINPVKTRRELGWEPRFEFSEAIEQTVRWYLDNLRKIWSV